MREVDPAFDPRTYGHKKLSNLVASRADLFKTRESKSENGAAVIEVKLAGLMEETGVIIGGTSTTPRGCKASNPHPVPGRIHSPGYPTPPGAAESDGVENFYCVRLAISLSTLSRNGVSSIRFAVAMASS